MKIEKYSTYYMDQAEVFYNWMKKYGKKEVEKLAYNPIFDELFFHEIVPLLTKDATVITSGNAIYLWKDVGITSHFWTFHQTANALEMFYCRKNPIHPERDETKKYTFQKVALSNGDTLVKVIMTEEKKEGIKNEVAYFDSDGREVQRTTRYKNNQSEKEQVETFELGLFHGKITGQIYPEVYMRHTNQKGYKVYRLQHGLDHRFLITNENRAIEGVCQFQPFQTIENCTDIRKGKGYYYKSLKIK